MPEGPGKYDKETEELLERDDADAVMIIVFGGKRGSGFSVSSRGKMVIAHIPRILRIIADQIARGVADV